MRFSFFMTVIVLIFLYAPIMFLVIFSFNSSVTGANWMGFTLKWYGELFLRSPDIWEGFKNSLIVAVFSSLTATLIGTMAAIGIHWYKPSFRRYINFNIYAPLIIPDILMGVSMLMLFVSMRMRLSLFTIYLAHTTFSLSYVVLVVLARLENFDSSLLEAAMDLGANEFQTVRRVIIPMALPGIIASFLLSFTLSIDDFIITFFVAGPGSTTLPLRIFSMIRFGLSPVVNALSTILVGGAILLTLLGRKFLKYILAGEG